MVMPIISPIWPKRADAPVKNTAGVREMLLEILVLFWVVVFGGRNRW
jgi:hypothetical protein